MSVVVFPKQQLDYCEAQLKIKKKRTSKARKTINGRILILKRTLKKPVIVLQNILNANDEPYIKYYPRQREECIDLDKLLTPRGVMQLHKTNTTDVMQLHKTNTTDNQTNSNSNSSSNNSSNTSSRNNTFSSINSRRFKRRKIYTCNFMHEEYIPPVGMRTATLLKNKRKKDEDVGYGAVIQPEEIDLLRHFIKEASGVDVNVINKKGKLTVNDSDGKVIIGNNDTIRIKNKDYLMWDLQCAINATYGGSRGQLALIYGSHNLYYPNDNKIRKIRNEIIFPQIVKMHKDSVKEVIINYKFEYIRLHPEHPEGAPVPVGLAMDGRWQKRYGWNSLDGHGLGHIFFPNKKDQEEANLVSGCCIGVFTFHRNSPSGKRKLLGGIEMFEGSAKSMDPESIKKGVKMLLDNGLDVTLLLHDNDSTGIKVARATKKKFRDDNPNSNFSEGIQEELCIRHGGGHAGKDFINLARSLLPVHKVRVSGRQSGPFTWGCSDACKKYITTCFRNIVYMNDTVEGLEKDFSLFLEHHLFGEHDNTFCYKYGYQKCHESKTPKLTHDLFDKVVQDFKKRWCTKVTLEKYINCRDTNFEESANFTMITLYPKRLFGSSGVGYDIAAHTIPLMLNQGGWNFLLKLYENLGMMVPQQLAAVVDSLEAEYLRHAVKKVGKTYKNRVVQLKKIRSGQYLKNQKGYQHGKKVRKHDRTGNGESNGASSSSTGGKKRRGRRCGICMKKGIEEYKHSTGKKCPYFVEYQREKKK
jgi:hypothetical protein